MAQTDFDKLEIGNDVAGKPGLGFQAGFQWRTENRSLLQR